MKRKMACIFDLDGTIVDSIADLTSAINYALEKNQFPSSYREDQVAYMVGNGIRKLVERALPVARRDDKNSELVMADFMEHYFLHCVDKTRPFPGIPEALRQLRERGILLAVLSNKADVMVKKIVPVLFGEECFTIARGIRDALPPKPNPASAIMLLEELGVGKENCCFIGDSSVDMKTSVNCGCIPIGVLWGLREREDLISGGAARLVEAPDMLPQAVYKALGI